MVKIFLVRHGEADKHSNLEDPNLTELGQQQARALAQRWAASAPLTLVSSPKARAQQTALPLANTWQTDVIVEPAVIEIPSPEGMSLAERGGWIRHLLNSTWDNLTPVQQRWRRGISEYLLSCQQDTMVFCHFMVINSVVADIRGDRSIRQFHPNYTSVTELQLNGGALKIRQLGEELRGRIL